MRLFIAVGVGDEVRSAVSRLRAGIEASLRRLRAEPPRLVWVAPEGLHLSLRFLGEQDDAHVPALVEAIQTPFPLQPFVLTWHGLGAFPSTRRPRAIWLGVSTGARELGQLEVEVARRFGRLAPGEEAEHVRPFHPHVTVARIKTESAVVDWPALLDEARVDDISSTVGHVALIRSRGLPGGVGYEEIGRGLLVG